MSKNPMIPTPQMRHNQYSLNVSTLNALNNLGKKPNDWIVTVAFYSALHLVEKKLIAKGKKTKDHKDRNLLVINNEELGPDVAKAYNALFKESMSARYYCIPVSSKRADEAIEYLKTIERLLA